MNSGLALGSDVLLGALGFTILTAAAVWVHEVRLWAMTRQLAQWIQIGLLAAEGAVFLLDILSFLILLLFSFWKFVKAIRGQV